MIGIFLSGGIGLTTGLGGSDRCVWFFWPWFFWCGFVGLGVCWIFLLGLVNWSFSFDHQHLFHWYFSSIRVFHSIIGVFFSVALLIHHWSMLVGVCWNFFWLYNINLIRSNYYINWYTHAANFYLQQRQRCWQLSTLNLTWYLSILATGTSASCHWHQQQHPSSRTYSSGRLLELEHHEFNTSYDYNDLDDGEEDNMLQESGDWASMRRSLGEALVWVQELVWKYNQRKTHIAMHSNGPQK